MDNKVKQVLNDLYMIDGSLKKQEKEIEQIVSELLESRPNVRIDDNFIRQLRAELVKRAKVMSAIEPKKQGMWSSIISGRKLAYSFTAVVMILAAIASVSYFFGQTGNNTPGGKVAVVTEREISKVKDNAFGSLSLNQSQAPLGLGGGVGGAPTSSRSESGGGGGSDTKLSGFYGPVNYHYVYKGGDFSVPEDKVAVYRRIKEIPLGDKITNVLGSMNFGLVDLGKFSNTGVSVLTVSENKDFGYEVTLDFREGSVYINPNWLKWPNPNIGCGRDQSCYERNLLKESDMPSNENLIAIANGFLSDRGIDRGSYGEPTLVESYGWIAADGFGKKSMQVPEVISVLYPLKINGQESYDQSGNPDGLVVDVNIRYKKANSARNLFLQKFESSDYSAETNKAKIISFAEGGGLNGNYDYPEAQKTIEVELGTPKTGFVLNWRYEPQNGSGYGLYVPAYIFPIVKISEGGYVYQKSMVVPMVKEMLERPDGGVGVTEPPIKSRININH